MTTPDPTLRDALNEFANAMVDGYRAVKERVDAGELPEALALLDSLDAVSSRTMGAIKAIQKAVAAHVN